MFVAITAQLTNINYEALSTLLPGWCPFVRFPIYPAMSPVSSEANARLHLPDRTPKAIKERLHQLKKKAVAEGLVIGKDDDDDAEAAPVATVSTKAVGKAKGGAKGAANKDGTASANADAKAKGGKVKASAATTKGKGKAKAVETDEEDVEEDNGEGADDDEDTELSDLDDDEFNTDGDDEPEQEEEVEKVVAKPAGPVKKKGTAVPKGKNVKAAAPKATTAAKPKPIPTNARGSRAGKSTATAVAINTANETATGSKGAAGPNKRKRNETDSAPAEVTATTTKKTVKKTKVEPVDDDEILGLRAGPLPGPQEYEGGYEDDEEVGGRLLGVDEVGQMIEESFLG